MNRFNSTKLKVLPLTRKNLSGELYRRSNAVEDQIKVALNLETEALIDRANISDHKEKGFLQEECLVALIRAALKCCDDKLAKSLFEILMKRCIGYIYQHVKIGDRNKRDDAFSDVTSKLVEQIVDIKSDKADFLQIRFWYGLRKLTITAFNKHKKTPYQNEKENPIANAIEKDDDNVDKGPLERLVAEETITEATKSLYQLSEIHHDVFILRYKYDWPIESKDPNKPTLSKQFGVTPKTIRNWLAQCKKVLKKLRKEGKI